MSCSNIYHSSSVKKFNTCVLGSGHDINFNCNNYSNIKVIVLIILVRLQIRMVLINPNSQVGLLISCYVDSKLFR